VSASDHSSPAFGSSVLLHAGVIAVVLVAGYLFDRTPPPGPKIFELVAGEGNNYMATAASKLGDENAPDLKVPNVAAAAPRPTVVPPLAPPLPVPPAPTTPATATPAPVTPAPAKTHRSSVPPASESQKAAKTPLPRNTAPDFKKVLTKASNRKETHELWLARVQAEKARKAEEKRLRDEAHKQKMSYDDYLKSLGKAGPQTAKSRGVRGGVARGTSLSAGAGGKALTREMADAFDAWFSLLQQQLKENFLPPPDFTESMTAQVEFHLATDGTISRVHIARSSGSAAVDSAIADAFTRVRMPPPPDHKADDDSLEFSLRSEN
jgi:colicin import membrane protein